jgi:excisionase family DNA binding protein
METVGATPWMTTEEAARQMGKPVSYLHKRAKAVGIPRVKIGNQYHYHRDALDAWMLTQGA